MWLKHHHRHHRQSLLPLQKIKVMLERAEELKEKLNRIFITEYEQVTSHIIMHYDCTLHHMTSQRMREEQKQLEEQKLREHQQEVARQRLLEQQQLRKEQQEEEERRRLEQQRQDEIAAAAAAASQQTVTPGASLERDGPHTSLQFGNNSNAPPYPATELGNDDMMSHNSHVMPLGGVATAHMIPHGDMTNAHMIPPESMSTSHMIPPPGGVSSYHVMPPENFANAHMIPPGGVSPVVDRSNKPTHLIQQETHPQDHTTHPIVDRSTKPKTASHDPMADMFLKGIGEHVTTHPII